MKSDSLQKISEFTAKVNQFLQAIFNSHWCLPLVTNWAFMCGMSGFVSDSPFSRYRQLRPKIHQRATCALLEDLGLGLVWGVWNVLAFEAAKQQELRFFVSPFCRILRSFGIVCFRVFLVFLWERTILEANWISNKQMTNGFQRWYLQLSKCHL